MADAKISPIKVPEKKKVYLGSVKNMATKLEGKGFQENTETFKGGAVLTKYTDKNGVIQGSTYIKKGALTEVIVGKKKCQAHDGHQQFDVCFEKLPDGKTKVAKKDGSIFYEPYHSGTDPKSWF